MKALVFPSNPNPNALFDLPFTILETTTRKDKYQTVTHNQVPLNYLKSTLSYVSVNNWTPYPTPDGCFQPFLYLSSPPS